MTVIIGLPASCGLGPGLQLRGDTRTEPDGGLAVYLEVVTAEPERGFTAEDLAAFRRDLGAQAEQHGPDSWPAQALARFDAAATPAEAMAAVRDVAWQGIMSIASVFAQPAPKVEDPDACWRCDAVPSTTDVGLCDPCRVDLAAPDPAAARS